MQFNNIPRVSQPQNLRTQLFPHQLASIYKMEKLECKKYVQTTHGTKKTRIGIFADKTGYGKTLSLVGLILRDKMPWNMHFPWNEELVTMGNANLIETHEIRRLDKLPTTLIVVSPSIISQWATELGLSSLRVCQIRSKADVDYIPVEEYDVVLVILSMYNNLVKSYSKYAWKRFIFDEPGHNRISQMIKPAAEFYWLISATPENIYYKHLKSGRQNFIKQIIGPVKLYWDYKKIFEKMIIRNPPEFIEASFQMPPSQLIEYKTYQPLLRTLQDMLSPEIETMIEAGNIQEAIQSLGGGNSQNIIEVVSANKSEELESIKLRIKTWTRRNNPTQLEKWTSKKLRIENQLTSLEEKYQNMFSQPCFICCKIIKNPVLETNCQNIFCGDCLLKWLQSHNTCPICRKITIPSENLIYIQKEIVRNPLPPGENIQRPPTKIQCILRIIKSQDPLQKFIIFSSRSSSFNPICNVLQENNISWTQIRGNVANRDKSLTEFREGKTRVIFLNSRYDGSGLNLQEASDIILYHPMDSSLRQQILGRAQRIGRKGVLRIHQLI